MALRLDVYKWGGTSIPIFPGKVCRLHTISGTSLLPSNTGWMVGGSDKIAQWMVSLSRRLRHSVRGMVVTVACDARAKRLPFVSEYFRRSLLIV